MDKRVIFAVAGSGKTTHIVKSLDNKKRSLILTYTTGNHQNLKNKIIKCYLQLKLKLILYNVIGFHQAAA